MKRIALVVVLCAAAVLWAATAATAAAKPKTWRTCVPQATLRTGIYAADNDLFTGRSGPSCVSSSNGHDITLRTCYRAQPGGVVAYPAVRIGSYYYAEDPDSGLPAAMGDVSVVLHIRDTGHAPGTWIDDVDAWTVKSTATARQHGTSEIVIVTRWHDWSGGGRLVRIGHRRWYVSEHKTGPAGHMWPLIRFVLARPTERLTVSMSAFMHAAARHRGWLRGRVLASAADGTEVWSGGCGLTDSMPEKAFPRLTAP